MWKNTVSLSAGVFFERLRAFVYCLRVSVRGEEKEVTILGIMISLAESHSALSAREALEVCVGI